MRGNPATIPRNLRYARYWQYLIEMSSRLFFETGLRGVNFERNPICACFISSHDATAREIMSINIHSSRERRAQNVASRRPGFIPINSRKEENANTSHVRRRTWLY